MQPVIALRSVSTDQIDDAQLAAVYRLAATGGGIASRDDAAAELSYPVDEIEEAIERLLTDRLLRWSSDPAGERLVAVDPEVAAAALVSPMERDIARRREQIAHIQQRTERYRCDYAAIPPDAAGAQIEQVVGGTEVGGYLDVVGATCRDEILVLKSGKQDDDELLELVALCGRLLKRGVTVRIVCQHRSRAELTIRTRLKRLTDAGAQIRTLGHIPRSAVVFDRSAAVLIGATEPGDGARSASGIRANPEVVGFLLDVFTHLWDAAAPLDTLETGYADVADDLQRNILELMAQGLTDEVVARKLGMSVRSCRRHIATLLQELGAISRFQAGVQAGRSTLRGAC